MATDTTIKQAPATTPAKPKKTITVKAHKQPINEDGHREIGEKFEVTPERRKALGQVVADVTD